MSTQPNCQLALPLAAHTIYGGEIYDQRGEMIANAWCLQCRNPDASEDERRQVAHARAAEIVRRVNLHDELANALSRIAYALHGKGDMRGVLHDVPAALERADAVLAKLEAR